MSRPPAAAFFMKLICFLMEGFPQGEETNDDLDPWRFSGGADEIWKTTFNFGTACLHTVFVQISAKKNKITICV